MEYLITSGVIFITFFLWAAIKYWPIKDISNIYAKLPKKWNWVFRVWFPAFLLPIGIWAEDKPILRLGLWLLFGVALFPEYWQKVNTKWHVAAAMSGILTMLVSIWFYTSNWWVTILWAIFALPMALQVNVKIKWLSWYYLPNRILWVELMSVITIYIGYMI